MKRIVSIVLLLPLLIQSAASLELTPQEVLIRQGMSVQMGELTGAGSKISLNHLQGLILPEGVLMKADCKKIIVKNKIDPKISDIVLIKVQETEIDASEFVGFVVE